MSLNNSQYDSIMRDYSRRQTKHRHLLEERIRQVREHLPHLREIDDAIASTSVAAARRVLSGETAALAELKQQIAALSRERQQILRLGGYPDDYLEMTYDCPDCRDTGYINNRKCHCFRRAEIELLYTQSNLSDILEQENFETFSYEYYSDELIDPASGVSSLARIRRVTEICRQFVDEFDQTPGNLFFYGDTGIGKTFLSHCIAKELLDSTHSVVYFSAQELFDAFAQERFSRPGELENHTDCIYNCDLLIIDDLGTELTNSFVNSELFLCINHRLNRKKATIISTNLSLKAFADTYSERIFSRISNHYTMLKLFGRDIRLQKKISGISAVSEKPEKKTD